MRDLKHELERLKELNEYHAQFEKEVNSMLEQIETEIDNIEDGILSLREAAKKAQDIEAYGCFMVDCGWSASCPECRVFKGLTSLGRNTYGVSDRRIVADKVLLNVVTGETSIFKDNKEMVFRGYVNNQRQLNLNVFQTLHKNRKW
jgi:Mg2+ and Co2+ transporter CorA